MDNLQEIWIEATPDRTIHIRRAGSNPVEVSGTISLPALLYLCNRIAAIQAPVSALPLSFSGSEWNIPASSFRSFAPSPGKSKPTWGETGKRTSESKGNSESDMYR